MKMKLGIPTEADWRSEGWGLDTPYAYRHFFGKDVDDALALLVEGCPYYAEDIMYMPLRCFGYYVLAYTEYLLSDASRDDSDGASCFFGLVKFRRNDIGACSQQVIEQIARTLERLRKSQEWYDADESIYGSFADQATSCLKLIGAKPPGAG
jgi:hypothetical protein